jgi:hypothetical protein
MAGEVDGGRPMAWHTAADDGVSRVPSDTRESVLTEDRPRRTAEPRASCPGLGYASKVLRAVSFNLRHGPRPT